MGRKYELHKRDAGSGARVSWGEATVKGKVYVLATVCKHGERWRFTGATKTAVEEKLQRKLLELETEGTDAVHLAGAAKRDAVKAKGLLGEEESLADAVRELLDARGMLADGEALRDAVRELVDCRRLLGLLDGDDKPKRKGAELRDAVKSAVADYAQGTAATAGRASMAAAGAFWARHHPDAKDVTLGQLKDEYLAERETVGNSPAHRRTLAQRMRTLVDEFGEGKPVADFTQADLEAFVRKRGEGVTVRTRNSWTTTMKAVFKFATERYHLAANPAALLKKGKVVRELPKFLGADDAERLLRAAEELAAESGATWIPAALALLLFAGVRPVELSGQYKLKAKDAEEKKRRREEGAVLGGMRWRHVLTGEGFIKLTEDLTKTTQARNVPMSRNLVVWMQVYGGEGDERIVPNPQAWRRAREAIEKRAGVEVGQDWLRHSFATMHLAANRDRGALEEAMGHTVGSKVLETDYRGLLQNRGEEARFWAILPTGYEWQEEGDDVDGEGGGTEKKQQRKPTSRKGTRRRP